MSEEYYAVILAGGKGERFWPLSTSKRPKQFLSIVGDKPLLQQAVERLEGLVPGERVLVITSKDSMAAARAAAPSLPEENIIGEPVGRDTAAAVALGAAIVKKRSHGGGAFCILTADHIIGDLEVFRRTLRDGFKLASEDDILLTIGMKPEQPSTGFGYIEAGDLFHQDPDGPRFFKARRFVEKPDLKTAEEYIAKGNYFWNSGMFIWSVSSVERALEKYRPQLKALINNLEMEIDTGHFEAALNREYSGLEKISVDYAIMEKADNVVMAEGLFAWDDVGSWPAIANHFPADEDGNIRVGNVEILDSDANIVVSKDRLTALIGVHDLVVVQAENATLVCPRERAQDIKTLVHALNQVEKYKEMF